MSRWLLEGLSQTKSKHEEDEERRKEAKLQQDYNDLVQQYMMSPYQYSPANMGQNPYTANTNNPMLHQLQKQGMIGTWPITFQPTVAPAITDQDIVDLTLLRDWKAKHDEWLLRVQTDLLNAGIELPPDGPTKPE